MSSPPSLFDPTSDPDAPPDTPEDGASEAATSSFGEALNPAQAQAVTASLQPQLVVAGPGTGKTRVLVHRTAHLLTEHADRFRPSEVAVITFTRKAARQLTARLADLVGAKAQHVRAGTIHQFCRRIVTDHQNLADVPDDFVVANAAVTDAFWQRWYDAHEGWCKSNDLHSFTQVKTRISRINLGIETIFGALNDGLRDYTLMLRERGAVDFDDLLTTARDLLRAEPSVRSGVREATRALLMDEFQDTDPVQFQVFQDVANEGHPDRGAHLFCVADDDQSIYRFRGARPKNVRDYVNIYGCTKEAGTFHILRTNYRSNRAIFQVAETVLPREERLKKRGDVTTVDDTRDPVVLVQCSDEDEELRFARETVQEWIEDGVSRRDIAVLAPWNSTVKTLEDQFLRSGIACEASSTDPILQVDTVQQILATFQVVRCILQKQAFDLPMRDLLEGTLPDDPFARLDELCRTHGSSVWGTFQKLATDRDAAEDVGLGPQRHQLARLYAAIGNVLQHARTDDATVGSLAAETMRQLGASTRLLDEQLRQLTNPLDGDGVQAAARVLRRWRDGQSRTDDGRPRLLLYDRSTRRVELWRQLVRRALDRETESLSTTGANAPAVFAASTSDHPRPLASGDVILTADLENALRWTSRHDAIADASEGDAESDSVEKPGAPTIVVLGPRTVADETLRLAGIQPKNVFCLSDDLSARPSVRLFKLLQAAVSPDAPPPLFDDYVMVDLETTSLDTQRCDIAEIGALRVEDGAVVDRFEVKVQLPDDLSADARETLIKICGLDPDTDFDDAVPLETAWAQFCDFAGARPLVAHNGRRFDFRVLKRLRKEHPSTDARWTTTYDTLPAAIDLCPELRQHSAEHLRAQLLGDDTPTAHRALADCEDQQAILDALQARRTDRERTVALEPLLPLLLAALYDEAYTSKADSFALTEDDAALLETGYRWALRDASPARELLQRVLPRGLPELVRATPELYDAVDEDQLVDDESGRQAGLPGRIEALLAPYRDQTLQGDGLSSALSHLALWGAESMDEGEDVVTLSTYHSAKGLEFERVLCTGVHDSAFPPFYANSTGEKRESRRLLYVGMTRAERHLTLTHPAQGAYGRRRRRSPFLRDAPDDLVTERRA